MILMPFYATSDLFLTVLSTTATICSTFLNISLFEHKNQSYTCNFCHLLFNLNQHMEVV